MPYGLPGLGTQNARSPSGSYEPSSTPPVAPQKLMADRLRSLHRATGGRLTPTDRQEALQEPEPLAAPVSHSSPGSSVPSPHQCRRHTDEQTVPGTPLLAPVSHSSGYCTTPSPQRTGMAPRARM